METREQERLHALYNAPWSEKGAQDAFPRRDHGRCQVQWQKCGVLWHAKNEMPFPRWALAWKVRGAGIGELDASQYLQITLYRPP